MRSCSCWCGRSASTAWSRRSQQLMLACRHMNRWWPNNCARGTLDHGWLLPSVPKYRGEQFRDNRLPVAWQGQSRLSMHWDIPTPICEQRHVLPLSCVVSKARYVQRDPHRNPGNRDTRTPPPWRHHQVCSAQCAQTLPTCEPTQCETNKVGLTKVGSYECGAMRRGHSQEPLEHKCDFGTELLELQGTMLQRLRLERDNTCRNDMGQSHGHMINAKRVEDKWPK